jgi:elongation factor Ts
VEISLMNKKLREKTGAGISDCKKALQESGGDFDKAIEYLRKKGAATTQKRSDRIAKEGIILAKTNPDRKEAAIVEVNCETDFVARSTSFRNFASSVLDVIFKSKSNDINTICSHQTEPAQFSKCLTELLQAWEKVEINGFILIPEMASFLITTTRE